MKRLVQAAFLVGASASVHFAGSAFAQTISPALDQCTVTLPEIEGNFTEQEKEDIRAILKESCRLADPSQLPRGIDVLDAKIEVLSDVETMSCYGFPSEAFCYVIGPTEIDLTFENKVERHTIPTDKPALCYAGSHGLFCVY